MRVRRRSGFTLVELLVVIGIIALLIGILLPALARSRAIGQSASCKSAMRQWGIALDFYLNEYRQTLPKHSGAPNGTLWTTYTDPGTWYNALPPYVHAPTYGDIYNGVDVGVTGGYSNQWIWYCPTLLQRKKNSNSGKNSYHYGMNALINGFFTAYGPKPKLNNDFVKVTKMKDAASIPMLLEVNGNSSAVEPENIDLERHIGKTSNVLFVDGHVESMRSTELPTPQQLPNKQWASYNPYILWGQFPPQR